MDVTNYIRTFNPHFFHFAIQRRRRQSQKCRCAMSPSYPPVGGFKNIEDIAPLEFLQWHNFAVFRSRQGSPLHVESAAFDFRSIRSEIFQFNSRTLTDGCGSLNQVLQFPYIAGPIVSLQHRHDFRRQGSDLLSQTQRDA